MLEILKTSTWVYILVALGIFFCLCSYSVRLAIHFISYKKQREISKKVISFSLVAVFLGYLGWGFWSIADPVKMGLDKVYTYSIGIPLTVLGFGLFFYSDIAKMGVTDKEALVTKGLYSKIRHPMYIGIILFHIGFPFIFDGFTSLISTIIWATFVLIWKKYEEKNLERKFGEEYVEYKKKTWF